MLSTQTNIALQLVATLTVVELAAFEKEFSKRFTSKLAQSEPKFSKKKKEFDYSKMAQQLLAKHQSKNIRVQD